jgi:predicted Zn-dependent peptidase
MSEQIQLPPQYFYHRLSNGIELLGQHMPGLSSITFGLQLNAAVVDEPAEKNGLAHLFEYMLFQGTKEKDARALNEAFESLGARKGASTGLETSQVWAQIVHTKFDETLALISELILSPTFPKDELEQMRSIILQEIRRRDDEPMSRIAELARAQFYQGTALARSRLGSTDSVRGLERYDLRQFWQEHYQPNNVLFAIAGKFDWEHVVEQVEKRFGGWQGQATIAAPQKPVPAARVAVQQEEVKQEHIALMVPFPNYLSPDFYTAQVVSEILGGSMASRLFVEVREKRGLVYTVSASQASNKSLGALTIYAGTKPEQAHECLEVIVNELDKLAREGITADELERAKVQLKSETVMRGEGSAARMGAITRSWWYERKIHTIQEVKAAIDAVSQESALELLQKYSPLHPLTVAAVGPLSQEELIGETLTR